jgi:hypothetical protein
MDNKTLLGAIAFIAIVVLAATFFQAASATAENPDWVYIKTITGKGTESQNIDVDAFVPSGYHWGVRGRYTAAGTASLVLFYAGSKSQDSIEGGKGIGTYIVNLDPSRSRDHGQGPLKVTAVNTISYELNFYYDANLGNQTQSATPTTLPTPTPTSNPAFPFNQSDELFGVAVFVVVVAVVAVVLVRRRTSLRDSK